MKKQTFAKIISEILVKLKKDIVLEGINSKKDCVFSPKCCFGIKVGDLFGICYGTHGRNYTQY